MRTTTYAQERLSDLYHSGGFTYDPLFGTEQKRGWAVGLEGYQKTFQLERINARDIDEHAQLIPHNAYQGGWVDDGTVYLDAVQIEPDRVEAVRLGVKNGQRAIYNLRTGELQPIPVELTAAVRNAA